eukprot:scaffold32614_cov69-Phaeocystis_antarctica.AAC.1
MSDTTAAACSGVGDSSGGRLVTSPTERAPLSTLTRAPRSSHAALHASWLPSTPLAARALQAATHWPMRLGGPPGCSARERLSRMLRTS